MQFSDRLLSDKPTRSKEGYLKVRARSARTGIYQYLGREIDPGATRFAADEVVNVYRSPEEVFAAESLGSFVAKPITDNHPTKPVTADNWRSMARGTIMGAVKDGEYVGFDLAFLDAAAVKALDDGKRELSNGYESELVFEDGIAPDGTRYRARQVKIRGNHIALVDQGRAGSSCRVGDAIQCDAIPSEEMRKLLIDGETYSADDLGDKNIGNQISPVGASLMATKQITFDGMPIEATDQAEAAIRKLEGKLAVADKRATDAETSVATLTTDKATLDAKVVTLEKQIEDAKLTPAQLRDAARAYQATADKAKALGVTVADEMDEAAIQRAVVNAKLGDAAKDWSDVQVAASFATLAKDAKPQGRDPVRDVIRDGAVTITDSATIHSAARAARVR